MPRAWIKVATSACGIALALLAGQAGAHKPSDSYLTLTVQPAGLVDVNWHIALRDLDTELRLDANDDGQLTWGELRPRWRDLHLFAQPMLRLSHGGQDCEAVQAPAGASAAAQGAAAPVPQIDTHTDGRYAVLRWTMRCPLVPGQAWRSLDIDYRLFALTDPTHRGLVRLRTAAGDAATVMLGTQRPRQQLVFDGVAGLASTAAPAPAASLDAGPSPDTASSGQSWALFTQFVQDGFHHIAIGTDHLLFLLSLLLVSAWQRERPPQAPRRWWPPMAGWQPRARWTGSLGEVLRLVTAFTLAHSITLSLAAFGIVSPPSRGVESLIALSVLVAALDNLWPLLRAPRWMVVFAFGLIHGFGFAGALQDLGLSRASLVVPLLGFNLGVELGQLALVCVSLPLICLLRRVALYRWAVVGGGSVFIAITALIWLIERVFDIAILGWGR
jgi:HupE / UreJ protein